MGKLWKNEKGYAVVEATLLLPFCLIMIIALYYVAIFLCQKANMQANLHNTLIYFKNQYSDTFVETRSDLAYEIEQRTMQTAYKVTNISNENANPYRHFRMDSSETIQKDFEAFFRSICGYMFFDDGSNIEISVEAQNNVVYKQITAKAHQTVRPAISFAMIGIADELDISCNASVVVFDGDDLIRNTDLAVDIIQDTKIGDMAGQAVDKVKDFYGEFKEKFGVN